MTVIAWDGTTLAADKRAVYGAGTYTITKVFRVDEDRLAGVAGCMARAVLIVDWLRRNGPPEEYPKQEDEADWVSCMVIHRDGRIHRYETRGVPMLVENTRHATGSGRDFATAAMHCGCSAAEAVAVACAYSADCGDGIDTLTFEEVA